MKVSRKGSSNVCDPLSSSATAMRKESARWRKLMESSSSEFSDCSAKNGPSQRMMLDAQIRMKYLRGLSSKGEMR